MNRIIMVIGLIGLFKYLNDAQKASDRLSLQGPSVSELARKFTAYPVPKPVKKKRRYPSLITTKRIVSSYHANKFGKLFNK